MWQKTTPDAIYGFSDADSYCEALELAGNEDWRLPVMSELTSTLYFDEYLDIYTFLTILK